MKRATKWGILTVISICLAVFMTPFQADAQSDMWTPTSGPVGGASVYSIALNADTIYASTFDRGVWRSPDGGSTWKYIYGLTFFAGDHLLTPYGRLFEANEDGIRYSDDGGESWTDIEFEREAEELESGYGIVAANMDEDSYEVHDSYIQVSVDSGKTWMQTHIDSAKGVNNVSDIAVVSKDSLLAATDKGVYVMTIEDTTWTQSALTSEVSSLAMADGRIFADMYKSTDMGASWDSLESYPMSELDGLKAAPTGDIYALVSLDSVFHSPDFGSSWSHLSEENLARLDVRSMAVDQQGNFYLGLYESGLFRYSTDMESWNIIGPPTTNVLDMYTRSDGNVLVGTERSGLNMYMTSEGAWSKEYGPYENQAIGLVDSAGDRVIMSRVGSLGGLASVNYSDDMGQTWTKNDSALVADEFPALTATGYAYSEFKGMYIGTLEGGVYHSMDGNEWEAINDSLPGGGFTAPNAEIKDLAIGPNGTVFIGINEGLFEWNESDSYWSEVNTSPDSLLDAEIPTIAVHPNGAVIAGSWIRPSGSTSWDTLNMPTNDAEADIVEINDEGTIYLASENEVVYKSADMGQSWEAMSGGFPDNNVTFTDMVFTEDKVLVGVEHKGVYQWSRTSTSVDPRENELPDRITLKQNYPNPFNPTTQIEFSLPQAGHVTLTVYDVLGRRVATLIDRKQQAGKHSVTFDASNLPSGVYIYQLKAGEFSESRKMLLVK